MPVALLLSLKLVMSLALLAVIVDFGGEDDCVDSSTIEDTATEPFNSSCNRFASS